MHAPYELNILLVSGLAAISFFLGLYTYYGHQKD